MTKQPIKKKQIAWHKKFLLNVKQHKLITFLIVLVLLFPANFIYSKYLDWDNAQLINGLANDFPALVEEIEKETGLDLDVKISCSTTSEKYTAGVKTCEMKLVSIAEQNEVDQTVRVVVGTSKFNVEENKSTGNAKSLTYRNKSSCELSTEKTVYMSCITHVRDANIELAKEVFSNK